MHLGLQGAVCEANAAWQQSHTTIYRSSPNLHNSSALNATENFLGRLKPCPAQLVLTYPYWSRTSLKRACLKINPTWTACHLLCHVFHSTTRKPQNLRGPSEASYSCGLPGAEIGGLTSPHGHHMRTKILFRRCHCITLYNIYIIILVWLVCIYIYYICIRIKITIILLTIIILHLLAWFTIHFNRLMHKCQSPGQVTHLEGHLETARWVSSKKSFLGSRCPVIWILWIPWVFFVRDLVWTLCGWESE